MDLSGDEASTASLHLNSSSSNQEDDRCDYTNTVSDDGYHHQPITTTNPSTYCLYDDDDDENYFSRIGGHGYLSDGIVRRKRTTFSQFLTASLNSDEDDDGDGQLLGDNPEAEEEEEEDSEDIDNEEAAACYSLPETPLRGQKLIETDGIGNIQVKEYASENELASCNPIRRRPRRRLCSARPRREREASVTKYWDHHPAGTSRNSKIMQVAMEASADDDEESESGGGGGGLVVITKAKGGKRALCMDLEEVQACKDLGFELEHERVRMMQVPSLSRLSLSSASIDTTSATATSSGANSPIANWRISSPGDDPRDVKARLKVWAQAVALASTTSRHGF